MSVDPAAALPSRPSPGEAGARLAGLYSQHARMVYGICRMLLRDADEAEDATQQVFLSAYSSLLTGTHVRDPAAWLGTIARNDCRRRATLHSRERYTAGDEVTLVSPAADDTAIGREAAAALYAQLAVLPEKQREAVVLRDMFGLRYDEVARALGTSRPAVEALLFRGRRRLQRRLRPDLVAGVLVVPVALQESLAYAVPGFAATSASAGAVAAAGIPLVAKLAVGGSALALAGSGAVVVERTLHDPPARPADAPLSVVGDADDVEIEQSKLPPLLAVPPGGFPVVRTAADDSAGTARNIAETDEDERGDEPHEDRSGSGDGNEPGELRERVDNSGPGNADDGGEHEDRSGPGGDDLDVRDDEKLDEEDNSGPGGGGSDSSGPGPGDDDD